ADVDERAEGGDVADDALENHAGLQVLELLHALREARGLKFRARIAAGLLELLQNVSDRRHAELLVRERFGRERAQEGRVADELLHAALRVLRNALDDRIRFRVHGRRIERLRAFGDAQKARALLERLLSE